MYVERGEGKWSNGEVGTVENGVYQMMPNTPMMSNHGLLRFAVLLLANPFQSVLLVDVVVSRRLTSSLLLLLPLLLLLLQQLLILSALTTYLLFLLLPITYLRQQLLLRYPQDSWSPLDSGADLIGLMWSGSEITKQFRSRVSRYEAYRDTDRQLHMIVTHISIRRELDKRLLFIRTWANAILYDFRSPPKLSFVS
ncbi:hypothetical protein GGS23DRAFT_26684 [Durotheca rogersii]|uniref:uncharacterized protein n=1 Tax=Durotheca rogersii TaxID=419775 RepID=UPI00221E7712|nr:uncharacterized protein GGS23DRAFT_26684 [Durotheca rogersii]KAI5868378.1 hypothetical protein GGS23DRAFT_26684 [Durotheca rogersii]